MTICLYKLLVTGPNKAPAELDFKGKSHLVFGPTDTGKSHVVECIRFCLGGSERPENVGFSEGYTRVVLQVGLADGTRYTIFRDLLDGEAVIYSGVHVEPPQQDMSPLDEEISTALVEWGNASGRKILIKAGQTGNLSAGDLRRVSIFGEIETLNKVSFEGKDTNLKQRNKSALALILTGVDDSDVALVPSSAERNIAKGHVEAIKDEIASLQADIPAGASKQEAEQALLRVSNEIEEVNNFVWSQEEALAQLNEERANIESEARTIANHRAALSEAKNRFLLLDKKYENDLLRLQAIGSAAAVVTTFETRPCPLCLTDIQHQARHANSEGREYALRQAALAEGEKILVLQNGLRQTISDISEEIALAERRYSDVMNRAQENVQRHRALLSPQIHNLQADLGKLTERKTALAFTLRDLERIERLDARLKEMLARTKRKKQIVERDVSHSANLLCRRIEALLDVWGVPNVDSVYFDEKVADIEVNQRKRTSYGKGKRGIFLTAYMVALMEMAIKDGYSHLGFLVVDSPVVTYKDPKHAKDGAEDLLGLGVKDRFYAWLADREENGQVIVLENEEPEEHLMARLPHTEFFGAGSLQGRNGFYPLSRNG